MDNTTGFFGATNTKIDYTTNKISWNLNPAHFGEPCFETGGQQVTFTFNLGLTVNNKLQHFIVSNAPDSAGDSLYPLPDMFIKYGCVAADTPITFADGSTKPISDVDTGDVILSGSDGRLAKITDFTYGTEAYMYRIATANRHVLASSGHPFITPQGVRLARQLKVGDTVLTEDGTETLSNIEIVEYGGKVINFKVTEVDDTPLDLEKRTFMVAGFVGGDAEMQMVYETKHDRSQNAILKRLPKIWHEDYFLQSQQVKK